MTGRDDQRALLDALRALPRRQRDCLVLRYYLDLGVPEIADTLELSPNSVKTHLQRGFGHWNPRWRTDDERHRAAAVRGADRRGHAGRTGA